MLVHTQCGAKVRLNSRGEGICPNCGKKIHVRISNK